MTMEALVAHAERPANGSDETGRKQPVKAFRDLSYSLESPDESLQRIMYGVGISHPNSFRHHADRRNSICRRLLSVSALIWGSSIR